MTQNSVNAQRFAAPYNGVKLINKTNNNWKQNLCVCVIFWVTLVKVVKFQAILYFVYCCQVSKFHPKGM